jgi:hypothetical protein
VHQHIQAQSVLHPNGICHLLVNQALIVGTAQRTTAQQRAQPTHLRGGGSVKGEEGQGSDGE